MESHAAHCILPTNTQHLTKLHCTEKKPFHCFVTKLKMVQILITCDKAQNLQLTDTSYLLSTVERYPIYIKQGVVSSIFKCSYTGEQQNHFQPIQATKCTLQKNMISTICTNISWFHDNEFCQFSLFTASFPENFQLYSTLWCVI
jgi:hypothetical protein